MLGRLLAPPQVGAHAREQLGEPERLDQVVVGAGVQADDDVELLVAGGEDEDGHVGVGGAQAAAHLDAVDVGEPEVEDDEPDVGPDLRQRRAAAGQAHHAMSLRLEHAREARRNCLVVLDEEHARLGHIRRR